MRAVRKNLITGMMCTVLALGSIVSGCGGSSNGSGGAGNRSTPELVATWNLVRTSGGIMGGGYPVTPGMETLTFNKNGTFTRTVNGQATSGTYMVTKRQTPFSETALPVITYNTSTLPDVVAQVDDLHLIVNEEAADGYYREYERNAQMGQL